MHEEQLMRDNIYRQIKSSVQRSLQPEIGTYPEIDLSCPSPVRVLSDVVVKLSDLKDKFAW